MRVALLSYNAQLHNAVGNHVAEKVRFFQERGAEVRVFVQDGRRLHPELRSCALEVVEPRVDGPAWAYLQQADLIFAVYAQYHDLLQYLPLLAGTGPRIVFDYLGVTPPALWPDQHREGLEQSIRQRGYVRCADHALTTSRANHRELLDATAVPEAHVTTMPLAVELERFRPQARERYWQQRLGIDGRILLYVGRLASNKRVPLLIEALTRLADRSLHAVLVGDCSDVYAAEVERCRTLAHRLGVADRVHFAGALDDADLPRAYRGADVLVMPSLHEGFCVPVIEAMACGLPVVASRSAALPETVGDAGLTFSPNDVDDLTRQLRRVLSESDAPANGVRRIAVVSFRFGPDIVGGAETSLRTMAKALQETGHHVEVFTTCTQSESRWRNELPAGTATLDGLTVRRFPIDPHDHAAHGEIVRTILEADGRVSPEIEAAYWRHSIHSSALVAALRQQEFDAIIVGPYLFGLTADIATEFSNRTLVVPCFHDEPLARLTLWPKMYSEAGGVLYHSAEEQTHAQAHLGVNHPNAHAVGTFLQRDDSCSESPRLPRPYAAYCGRYSAQKNVRLLLDWAQRYRAGRPDGIDFVFMGEGEVKLPTAAWLHDLGRVDESIKRAVLAGAKALVQLSTHESLSLVALEAWAEGTPVIAHGDCAVLAGQIARSQGGVTVADYEAFAETLDALLADEPAWRERGAKGGAYVDRHYATIDRYIGEITDAINQMTKPLREQMRARGLERARQFGRDRWQARFAEWVENLLTQPGRAYRDELRIEPLRTECNAGAGGSLLLPVRLVNAGTHAVAPDGPGRTVICSEIHAADGQVVVDRIETRLPQLVMPGQACVAAVPITIPEATDSYRILLCAERHAPTPRTIGNTVEVPLTVRGRAPSPLAPHPSPLTTSVFLDTIQETLPKAHHLQQLPADYVDVTEGRLAPVKRLIKRKVLHNFKHAYVDVLSRQQSQFNGHVVLMIQQLAECCAVLDHAVAGFHLRLDALEKKIDSSFSVREAPCER